MVNILLADDQVSIRDYCRLELEDEGYCVTVARDGSEVIRLMANQTFDLIILDICMPGVSGLETAERIKRLKFDVPVIFFTSFDDICQADPRARHAVACVEKRADLTDLKHVVATTLAAHRQGRRYRLGLPPAVLPGTPA